MTEHMPLQPDPDPSGRTLVQPEGVNAGSDVSTNEAADAPEAAGQPSPGPQDAGTPPHGDPLHPAAHPPGGTGDRDGEGTGNGAGDRDGGQGYASDPGLLAGAPDTTAAAPGQYAAESGQDSGSSA